MPSGLRPALRGLWSTRRWPDAGWDKVGRFSEPVREARSDCERQKKGEIWNTFCSADYTQQAPSHTDRQMLTHLAAGVAALLKAKTKYFTRDFKQRAQYTLWCLLLKKKQNRKLYYSNSAKTPPGGSVEWLSRCTERYCIPNIFHIFSLTSWKANKWYEYVHYLITSFDDILLK